MTESVEVNDVERECAGDFEDLQPCEESFCTEVEKTSSFDPEAISIIVEALLFASGEPVALERLSEVVGVESVEMEQALTLLGQQLIENGRGIELVRVADKYQLRTKSQYSRFIQNLAQIKPRRLSPAALETLSVIAYRQPVVKSDIEKIRGVDATPTIKTLLDRRLIRIVGHQATVGQPALYGTTEDFLKLFGLGSLAELPSLRDLAELEADPGESGEDGPVEENDDELESSQAIS